MCVHLVTNSLVLVSDTAFQNAVYQIHSLGPLLPVVEWSAIFIPLIFHAVLGVYIGSKGKSNVGQYAYPGNWRYFLQRKTGYIAFIFICLHVLHLHGWIHVDVWLKAIENFGMARFRPYNASSTAANAIQASPLVPILYAIGMTACVFHFVNGLWTMGITWGVWVTPSAQRMASFFCAGLGVVLFGAGMGSLVGLQTMDSSEALENENRMYEQRVLDGSIIENEHKRSNHE